MAIPVRAVLRGELHCLSQDGAVVITAQRWADPSAPAERPRSWMRLVRNGRVEQVVQFTGERSHRDLETAWAMFAERYAPTALTQDQMWVKLRELAEVEKATCQRRFCSGSMPVAWHHCQACGRDARRVAGGAMTAARSSRVIVVPAGAFQRSNPS